MTLGERIYKLRTEKEMSQEDLAVALEVSRQSISKWETNGSVPALDKLVKLSEIFGVSLDELVTGKKAEADLGDCFVCISICSFIQLFLHWKDTLKCGDVSLRAVSADPL